MGRKKRTNRVLAGILAFAAAVSLLVPGAAPAGAVTELTGKEFDEIVSRYTVSKDFLLDRISFEIPDCTEKSLKQHVYNLRKKLSSIHSSILIETIRSVGFKLTKVTAETPIA